MVRYDKSFRIAVDINYDGYQIDEEQMIMLGGSADTASHVLLYNLTSGQSVR